MIDTYQSTSPTFRQAPTGRLASDQSTHAACEQDASSVEPNLHNIFSLFSVFLVPMCPIASLFAQYSVDFLDQVLRLCSRLATYVEIKTH